MSRAIGDLFLKPYVSAEPDVRAMPIVAADEFIVLASDGVYDVLNNEQVVQIARSAASPEEAAQLLTESAYVAGSLDNATGARACQRGCRAPCPPAHPRALPLHAAVVVALRGYKPTKMAASPLEPWSPVGGARRRAASAALLSDAPPLLWLDS